MGDIDADYIQTAKIKNRRPFASELADYQYNFHAIDDGSWRRVHMDIDWLYALTPFLGSSTSGWTSLAAFLSGMGMDNSTDITIDWWNVRSTPETIIATFVGDKMSRQGYNVNGGTSMLASDALYLMPWDISAPSQQSLVVGTFALPRSARTATQLRWSVVVGGYAYKADSFASYLDSFLGLIDLTARWGMHRPYGTVDII